MDGMKELERLTERLLEELEEIRRSNRNLSARVKKLEKARREAPVATPDTRSQAEVRERVERLVEDLERLDSL